MRHVTSFQLAARACNGQKEKILLGRAVTNKRTHTTVFKIEPTLCARGAA